MLKEKLRVLCDTRHHTRVIFVVKIIGLVLIFRGHIINILKIHLMADGTYN